MLNERFPYLKYRKVKKKILSNTCIFSSIARAVKALQFDWIPKPVKHAVVIWEGNRIMHRFKHAYCSIMISCKTLL